MTRDELRQAAIDYLATAFKEEPRGGHSTPHLIQAAVSILMMAPEEPKATV